MSNFRSFNSMSAFESAKPSLPTPSVCKITEGASAWIFYRGRNGDAMHTIGEVAFRVGQSVLGGKARV